MKTAFALVADGGHASLYELHPMLKELSLLRRFAPPEVREPHGKDGHTDTEVQRYAHMLTDELRTELLNAPGRDVILVAPAHFLGMIRHHLDHELTRRVIGTVSRDYIHLEGHALSEALWAALDSDVIQRLQSSDA